MRAVPLPKNQWHRGGTKQLHGYTVSRAVDVHGHSTQLGRIQVTNKAR